MGHPLKIIEQKLADFFEKDLLFFSKKDDYSRIISRVIDSLEENAYKQEKELIAPNIYRVEINPDIQSEDLPKLNSFCANYLQEFCREHTIKIAGPLQISFQISNQPVEDLTVSAKFSQFQLGNTIRIPSAPTIKNKNSKKRVLGFLILWNDEIFEINKPSITIGREISNDLVVDNLKVSRNHAQIKSIDSRLWILDQDSTMGTYVNGEKIRKKQLYTGDVISVSDVPIVYCDSTSLDNFYGGHTTKMNGLNK